MNFLFGSGGSNAAQVPDTALRIQTAVAGKPVPVGCGQGRIAGNLIWYGDFQAVAHSQGGKGALFGGGKGGAQTFTYQAAVLWGLMEGPIAAVLQAWQQQNIVPLAAIGCTVILGDYTQAPWGYLTSNHPDQADNNRGLAMIGIGPAQLGNSSSLPNWTWEVLTEIANGISGFPDADPRDWITQLLTNQYWSVHFPSANLDTMDSYSNWCRSTAMVVSDFLVAQQSLNTYLQELLAATDSEFVWSSGKLSVVPYGDVVVNGHGASYTPASFLPYSIGDDDLLELTAGGTASTGIPTKSRVQIKRGRAADYDNWVQVEYLDRSNSYNATVAEAKDELAIELLGYPNIQKGLRSYHFFTLAPSAMVSAHLQLGRELIHNTYYFALGRQWLFLDPMDVIPITDTEAGIVNQPVRIKEITENQDGTFTIVAEEYLQGTGTPYNYNQQGLCCINDELRALIQDPGPTTFAYWDATLCAEPTGPAIIIAAAGVGQPLNPRTGIKGLFADWYYPTYFAANATASGSQILWKSAANDSGAQLILEAIFSGAGGNVQIGLSITATPAGHSPVTLTQYADGGPQASIPAGGYEILASWDFSTTTWSLNVRLNAGTVASGAHTEAAAMDPNHPLLENPGLTAGSFGTYQIGDGSSTSAMKYGQLWIGVDDDVSLIDLSLPDATWILFACDTGAGADAPINLNADGSAPDGCPPTFYFNGAVGTGYVTGISTGCLAGTVLPTLTGTASAIGTGTIPACGSYQAVGVSLGANSKLSGPQPFAGMQALWGSCEVWISTDGGSTYQMNPEIIPGPSPIGLLTALYALGSDPDTTDTLSVNLTESQGTLAPYATSDADAGRSRSVIMAEGANTAEIIDYSAATLTGANRYSMGAYVRRGQDGTAISAHAIGAVFAQLGVNAIEIPYPPALIGSTIHVKLPARNKTGGGAQSLANVPDHTIVLAGPGQPLAPASITAVEPVASSGSVVLSWPLSTDCGVTGYQLKYDKGGPVTTVILGNQGSTVLAGLASGTYTFDIYAINAAGLISATPATASLAIT